MRQLSSLVVIFTSTDTLDFSAILEKEILSFCTFSVDWGPVTYFHVSLFYEQWFSNPFQWLFMSSVSNTTSNQQPEHLHHKIDLLSYLQNIWVHNHGNFFPCTALRIDLVMVMKGWRNEKHTDTEMLWLGGLDSLTDKLWVLRSAAFLLDIVE